jgi:hypothetical protein
MNTYPFCHKCVSAILEEVADKSHFILIGCKENKDIGNSADAQRKCPLIQGDTDESNS